MATIAREASLHSPSLRGSHVIILARSALTQADIVSTALLWAIRVGIVLLFFTSSIVTPSTVFPFIVGLYVLLAIYSPRYRPRRSLLVVLFGLHLGAVIVAGVFGSSFNLSFWSNYERMGGIFDLAHWLGFASVLVLVVRGLREWKILITIYLGISWMPMLIAIGENFEYKAFDWVQIRTDTTRISGAAGNPTFLSGQMMVNGILAFGLMVDTVRGEGFRRRPWTQVLVALLAVTALASLWVLFETVTRGSMAGLAASAGLIALFSDHRRLRLVLAITGVVVPIAIILLFVGRDTSLVQSLASRNQIVDRVVSTSLTDGDPLRMTGLRIAGQAFAARPLTGWGGENFEVPFQRFQNEGEVLSGGRILDRAHNKPLDLLATTGVIGFTTYVAVWSWLGFLGWRRVRNETDHRIFHSLVVGAIVALFIHNLFLFDTVTTFLLFGLLAAWASLPATDGEANHSAASAVEVKSNQIGSASRLIATVLIALVVTVGIYVINYRTYRSAQLITETGSTVEEVIDNLDYFSPLSTFGRERLLNVMSARWETLDQWERFRLIPVLTEQADKAMAAEPNNMELQFAVACFYRTAARESVDLVALAGFHTALGVELGPNTASAMRAQEEQQLAEAG